MRPLVIGGAPQTITFLIFLGPTSLVEVQRGPKQQETALEHKSLKDIPGKWTNVHIPVGDPCQG
jgi:hypothetical protein